MCSALRKHAGILSSVSESIVKSLHFRCQRTNLSARLDLAPLSGSKPRNVRSERDFQTVCIQHVVVLCKNDHHILWKALDMGSGLDNLIAIHAFSVNKSEEDNDE